MARVALVTGASRGVGKGVALALGEAGMTVYMTGRTTSAENAAVPLAGMIHETAETVSRLGGKGIAMVCDHRDDQQVAAVFKRIQREQGRLDVLVNNAWAGYEGYSNGKHHAPCIPFGKSRSPIGMTISMAFDGHTSARHMQQR